MENKTTNELINVKEFLNSWLEIVPDSFSVKRKNINELIKNDMQLSDESIEELCETCTTSGLYPEDQVKTSEDMGELKDTQLTSLNYVLNNYGLTTKNTQALEIKLLRHTTKICKADVEPNNTIQLPDVVLTVQISQSLSSKTKRKFSWSEEYSVLGQNFLTSLKDKISCFRNEQIIGEFSENAEAVKHSQKLQDVIKSGYFLIHNTFYTDTRDDNTDCSLEVIKWARERKVANYDAKPMENTKFIDLDFKLGYPYLYTHLGNCEHLILFINLRLVNPSTDPYDLSLYPILKDRNRGRLLHCWLCNLIFARWVILGSEFLVDDPCLLCDRCFKNTHYNEKGNKLCNFEAYHFAQLI